MNKKELGSKYFRVHFVLKKESNDWVGTIRFKRKDTNESWGSGGRYRSSTRNSLEKTLKDKAMLLLPSQAKPYDWKSSTRPILIRYLKLREQITRFGISIDELANSATQEISIDSEYDDFVEYFLNQTLSIVKDIEGLTEKGRLDLLLSSNIVFNEPNDPYHLDDLTARDAIYLFFINPSKKETEVHQIQQAKIRDLYMKESDRE